MKSRFSISLSLLASSHCTQFLFAVDSVYSGINDVLYPLDALKNPGALYPLGGLMPSNRLYSSIAHLMDYVIIYGGYYTDFTLLDDIHMYDYRSRQWTGPILKPECCNNRPDKVETLGFSNQNPVSDIRVGYQGDIPLARAEHGACVVGQFMYMFGGVIALYGYSQDFYSFDPIQLQWSLVSSFDGQIPNKRAGHAMVTFVDSIIIFGGRGSINGQLIGFNDVWKFNTTSQKWNHLAASKGLAPASRQHTAAAISSDKLFIYGGIDPVSNVTYNDVWVFYLDAQLWQQLEPVTGDQSGFAPPPLFSAHLIPVSPTIPLPIQGTLQNASTGYFEVSFLLYGGIGGGGACGSNVDCTPIETTLGQVYKFSAQRMLLPTPRLVPLDSGLPAGLQYDYMASSVWSYARMTTQGVDRGRLVKSFGLEQAVYCPVRRLLYEFGGLQAIIPAPNPDIATLNDWRQDDPNSVEVRLGDNPAVGAAPYLDAGGVLPTVLWDTATGEHLRGVVDIATNAPWVFQQAFAPSQPMANSSTVLFQHKFRTYSVAPKDIILLSTVTGS